MTRMTETLSGEIHWFAPIVGTETREAYDRARAGETITGSEAGKVAVPYAMEFDCIAPQRGSIPGQHRLRGEWHDFVYYPSSQVHRIEAEEYDRDDYREDDETELESD